MKPCARLLGAAILGLPLVTLPVMGQAPATPAPKSAAPAAPTTAAPPAHPATVPQIHEMMQLTGVDHLKQQMMAGFVPRLRQMMPFMPEDVMADFQQSFEKADLETQMVKSYQEHLSAEDATKIIAFYKTPAGQRMISAMPQIVHESEQAGAQLGQQTMMEVMQRHKAEIQAAADKYRQEHTAPSLSPGPAPAPAPAPQHR